MKEICYVADKKENSYVILKKEIDLDTGNSILTELEEIKDIGAARLKYGDLKMIFSSDSESAMV